MDYKRSISKISIKDIINASNIQYLCDMYEYESKSNGLPPINLDSKTYIMLEESGILDCIGVYNDDTLVGFAALATTVMPHYTEKSTVIES